MTTVFENPDADLSGPVTWAFVMGCGRFPHVPNADRPATVAGARAMLGFLVRHCNDFIAPLRSIRCLISDPAVAPGADVLGIDLGPHGEDADAPVDAVREDLVRDEAREWVDGMRPGDQAFLYMASHGIANGVDALGLLEDVLSRPSAKWSQSFNVSFTAAGLGTTGIERGWVFLDACQEALPEALGAVAPLSAVNVINFSPADLGTAKPTVSLAGSRIGGVAWAPTNGDPPYFTQALLEGLENACVEPLSGLGWAVTGEKLIYKVAGLGKSVIGWPRLQTQQLSFFNESEVALLKVANPSISVSVTTEVEVDLATALDVRAECTGHPHLTQHRPPGPEVTWRFRVAADKQHVYHATAEFAAGLPGYESAEFDAMPPAQTIVLKRTP
ncbi:hypothetical protein [uncultured Sphingomonas sp.]|uniref:hypothetical protein n=1 Tax=uncultured Sphingomonas sp. TaxID=158754 RepID=UPI003749F572